MTKHFSLSALLVCGLSIGTMVSCHKKADPTITLNGDENMTIYISDTWTDPGATATNYKGKDISDDVEITGTVGADAGVYTIDYTVSDKGGFTVEQRNVHRGFKNTDLAGTYDVVRTTTNGGGSQTYTGTITAGTGDLVSITIDNTNSFNGSVIMNATITSTGLQFNIPDQSDGGCSISYGSNNFCSHEAGNIVLSMDFATNCGFTGVYNHTTTWTKQ